MSRFIQAVVDDDTHRALTILAPQKSMTLSDLINEAVTNYLKQNAQSQGEQKGSGGTESVN